MWQLYTRIISLLSDTSNKVSGPCEYEKDYCECYNSTMSRHSETVCACLPGFKAETVKGNVTICHGIYMIMTKSIECLSHNYD